MKTEFNNEILKGEIIIDKPLTLFTGRNNTGKSYAGKSLDVIYRSFKADEITNVYYYPRGRGGEYYAIATELEKELFDCCIEWNAGWLSIYDNKLQENVILNAADSILSFFSFIILLKYELKSGDTIVLDCPEQNQDPYNIIMIARYIAILINNGLNIILITHDHYLQNQLNNLIVLADIPESENKSKLMKEFGLSNDMAIKHTSMRHYHFSSGEVKEITVDADGLNIVDAADIAEKLYDERAMLWDLYNENK